MKKMKMMRTTRFVGGILSILLVLSMLFGSVAMMSMPGFAAESESNPGEDASNENGIGTPPEIVITGDTDTWDKSTYTEPTETDADGVTILINTAAEFAWFLNNTTADNVNTYRLTKNLDMASQSFRFNDTRRFGGVLDGAGFVISNLRAGMMAYSGGTALFYTVTGTIKNLTLKDYVHNNGLNGSTSFIQNLAGGTVSNVRIDGKWGTDSYCAGIANNASSNALIENCVISGTISGKNNPGNLAGIVGSLSNSIVRDCKNYASITSNNASSIGGIVTSASGTSTIERCENYGAITSESDTNYAAGIIATVGKNNTDDLKIIDSINYGDLTLTGTTRPVAGIIALMGVDTSATNLPVISGCINYGNIVSSGDKVGGIAGTYERRVTVEARAMINCANYGSVTGKNYVGGIIGFNDGVGYGFTTGYLHMRNCVNYGDVTATESYAGGIAGKINGCIAAAFTLDGATSFGNVTAATYAGGIFGLVTRRHRNDDQGKDTNYTTTVNLSNYIASGTVTATAEDGLAGALFGYATVASFLLTTTEPLILNLTDVKVDVTVVQNGETIETPHAYHYRPVTALAEGETTVQYGPITGSTYDYSACVIPATALTDGTLVDALNSYVATNTQVYTRWMQGEFYPVFYVPSFSLNNTESLNREYDGEPSTVANLYTIKIEGIEVTVEWYNANGTELLSAAPTNVGSYQVKLIPKLGGVIVDDDVETIGFTIKKATTTVEIVIPDGYVLNQTTLTGAYNKDVTFTNENIEGLVKVKGTALDGVKPTVTISDGNAGTTAQNPGNYTITLAYAGDENYAASNMAYNMVIDKITVTYPENIWLRPDGTIIANQGGLKYTGSEQAVTLQFDEAIFKVTYQNNTLTNVSADDAYQTATAEVTLREDVETWYKFATDAVKPTYTLAFRMDKGEVVLKLLDAQDQTVELNNMVYDGTTKTFTVAVYDAQGTLLARIGTITVSDAKKYEESFVYAGTTQYLGGSLRVEFVVSPIKVNITQGSLDKTYDKNAVVPNPQFTDNSYSNTETYTWNDYVYVWQKLQTGEGSTYEDIADAPADAGTYKLTITRLTTDGNYEVNHEVNFVISRANATINPDWDAFEAVSDNNGNIVYHITYSGNSLVIKPNTDSDGDVTITYNGSTSSPNAAGEYQVIVSIAASNNYNALAEQTYTICIDKFKIEIPEDTNALWDYSAPFTYDGTAHSVSLVQEFMDKYADYLTEPAYSNNAQTAAAMEIIASVTLTRKNNNLQFSSDPNADDITITLKWVINKANVDISGITYNGIGGSNKTNVTMNYNGKEQSVVVGNLPDYLEVVGTIQGYTDVGTYYFDITYALKGTAEANYNKPGTNPKDSLTFTIIQTAVTIEITGQDTFVYDNEEKTFTATVKDAAGNEYGAAYILTITKDGTTVAPANVKTVGEYLFTYELNNSNLIGATASDVLTINKATYNASDYEVTSATTVKYDGKEHTVTLSLRAGLDGETIKMISTPEKHKDPGVYKITIQLLGSVNYNPISDLEVTLTILKADEAREDDQVKVEFQDGVDPTLNFEIVDADKTIVNTRDVFGENYSVKELLNFVLTDEQGEAVKANGTVTVTIVVPEKYRDGVTLSSFVQLVPKKDGTYTVRTFDQAKRTLNASYDETTGVCTFNVTDLSATYGYATEDNLLPQFILLGVAGVAIVGAIAVTVIRCKRAKRKEYEEE